MTATPSTIQHYSSKNVGKYSLLDDIEIPEDFFHEWQSLLDLIADIIDAPSALIMRAHKKEIEVFACNSNPKNPYKKGEKEHLDMGLYCETVMSSQKKLIVPNALKDKKWDHNPDIKLDMISYLGFPLSWPSGQVFGTICVLDNKENHYSEKFVSFLGQCSSLVNTHLHQTLSHHELFEMNQALHDFSMQAAHDIKSPIANIHSFSDLILNDSKETLRSENKEALEYIQSSSKRLLKLIDDLLKYALSGHSIDINERVDLNHIAQSVVTDLSSKIIEKEAGVQIDVLPNVKGSSSLLYQIFSNLIGNSLKYTREGVAPRIEVKYLKLPKQHFHLIQFTDNGIGFNNDQIESIFQPFQRLVTQEEYPGSGVGLSTVRKILEKHQGNIWAEGIEGEGASFTIQLPKILD